MSTKGKTDSMYFFRIYGSMIERIRDEMQQSTALKEDISAIIQPVSSLNGQSLLVVIRTEDRGN